MLLPFFIIRSPKIKVKELGFHRSILEAKAMTWLSVIVIQYARVMKEYLGCVHEKWPGDILLPE